MIRFEKILAKRLNPVSIITTSYLCEVINYAIFDTNCKETKYLAVSNIIDNVFMEKKKEKKILFDQLQVNESFNPKERYLSMFNQKILN